jgi:hypothetical protein
MAPFALPVSLVQNSTASGGTFHSRSFDEISRQKD